MVGVWGVILVITQVRSLKDRQPRTPVRETAQAVVGTGLGIVFAALAVAHFTGIHRQKHVHVLGGFVLLLVVLWLVGLRQRWVERKNRT